MPLPDNNQPNAITSGAQTVMRIDSAPLRSTSADGNSSTVKGAGLSGIFPAAASIFAERNSAPAAAVAEAARNRLRSTRSAMNMTSPVPTSRRRRWFASGRRSPGAREVRRARGGDRRPAAVRRYNFARTPMVKVLPMSWTFSN
jgi:hypothetical protein